MHKLAKSLVVVLVCLLAGTAGARMDVMDVSYHTDGMTFCGTTSAPFEQITAYLLIANPSRTSGVSGWEAWVTVEGGVVAPSWTLTAGLDVDPSDQGFQVGIGTGGLALPYGDTIILATYSAFVQNIGGEVHFYVEGVPGSTSFPTSPGYAAGNDAGDLQPLSISSGSGDLPVFSFNDPECSDPPPTEFDITVSADNGLYRDDGNHAAVDELASDGFGPLDIPSAPLPPGGYLQLAFYHPDWTTPVGQRFDSDVRAVFPFDLDSRTWLMRVDTDQTSRPIQLDFAQVSGLPQEIYLRNHDTGEYVDLVLEGMTYTFTPNPAGENYLDLIVGNIANPDLAPAVRTVPSGWSMLAMPLVPDDASLSAGVLDDATNSLFVMRHEIATGYDLLAGTDPLEQGRGYWAGAVSTFTWSMEGQKDLGQVTVPLDLGWNLIGYPLWFPSNVGGVKVLHDGLIYDWGDAVSAGILDGMLYTYGGSAYVPTEQLNTWHGYWLASYVPGASLIFDWQTMPTTALRPWNPYADLGDPDNWRLEIAADGADQTLLLGVCERASDGFDAFQDRPRAPKAPVAEDGPELYFPRAEWNLPTGEKARADIRASAHARALQWSAKLEAPEPGSVTLAWDRAAWGGDEDLEIYLPQEGRVAVGSMRSVGQVTLPVGEEPLDLIFRTASATTGVETPAATAGGLRAVPNPFNPRTELRFVSETGGRCLVRIFDVAGRCVRSLDAGRVPAGGAGAVVWQGRDDAGRELASGTYFARLAVDGRPQGATARLSLVR